MLPCNEKSSLFPFILKGSGKSVTDQEQLAFQEAMRKKLPFISILANIF